MAARQGISPEERNRFLAEWQASGLSAKEFAPRAGVTPHTLYAWRRRARTTTNQAEPPRFAEVVVRSSPAPAIDRSVSGLEIAIGEAVVRVGAGFDDAVLRRVLDVLRATA